jgi:hypothetical protein
LAYTRRLGAQEALVVINTAATERTLPPCPVIYPAGTKLQNLLGQNESLAVDAHGRIPPVVMPAVSAKIFVAESEIQPLDPVVTGILPAHDAKGVSPPTSVTIHFSEPMDTASVEAAFSTTPPVTGVFSWSAAHDEMVFSPAAGGFPGRAMVSIRIGDSAFSMASRKPFYGGFESRFETCERQP